MIPWLSIPPETWTVTAAYDGESEPRVSLADTTSHLHPMLCELTFPPPPTPSVFLPLPPENIFPLPIKLTDFLDVGVCPQLTSSTRKKKNTHTLVAYEHAQNTPLCVFIMLPVWEFVYMFMAILFFSAGILLARALPG